ncbi:rRNA biogenesis protein rrp5 [Ceratobasidium sp. UAMH 11750]|nr:rRNA biogenesis protein rrp5 [Ceratobasidium sp. UAMH 11750]
MLKLVDRLGCRDTQVSSTAGLFTVSQVVKSRLNAVDRDAHKLTASIRQAAPSFQVPVGVSSIQVGSTVSGTLTAVHDENAILSLNEHEGVMVLISLFNLANARETTVPQLHAAVEKAGGEGISTHRLRESMWHASLRCLFHARIHRLLPPETTLHRLVVIIHRVASIRLPIASILPHRAETIRRP